MNKNIYKAIATLQQEIDVIHKDTSGFNYTYADLPAVLKVLNPAMRKNGLGFYQAVNGTQLKTVIFHIESGEIIESNTDIPQNVVLAKMNEFQVLGSAITYIRRYALSSMLGLVTDKDTDAQGEQVKRQQVITSPAVTKKAIAVQDTTVRDKATVLNYIDSENDIDKLQDMLSRLNKSPNIKEEDKPSIGIALEEKLVLLTQ